VALPGEGALELGGERQQRRDLAGDELDGEGVPLGVRPGRGTVRA